MIGFSARILAVPRGIDWGTLDLTHLHGLRWKSLAAGSDVETFEDLKQLRQTMEDFPTLDGGNEENELERVVNDLLARHGCIASR